jgi:hypothetical protein
LRVMSWPTLVLTRVVPFGILVLALFVLGAYIWRRNDKAFAGRLMLAGRELPLRGHSPRDLEIAVRNGELVLQPATTDAEVIVRCLNRVTIELIFMDPKPERIESVRLKRGNSRSPLPNRFGNLIYV